MEKSSLSFLPQATCPQVCLFALATAALASVVLGVVVSASIKDDKALVEDFNACVTSNSAAQSTLTEATAGANLALLSEALGKSAVASVSLDGITSSSGLLVGLALGVVAFAGLWGEECAS